MCRHQDISKSKVTARPATLMELCTHVWQCHIGLCVKKFTSYKDKQKQGMSYAFMDIQSPILAGGKEHMGTDTGLPTYSGVCDGTVTTVTESLLAQVAFPAPQAIAQG